MPSASNKLEKQASLEVSEPFKVVLSVIEKKVRNLEKRKAKLDTLKAQTGELHDQQKEALTRYEEVVNTLEFSRDLMKNITHISLEAAKNQKKQAKRELLEQQARELQRVKELLILNSVLSSMGEEKTRQDFKAGINGATVLTEEELERLDNLFKLVTPCRTSEEENVAPFGQQLTSAAEHVVAILDGKKKDVLGSTYANLRELIFGIHQCEYFKSQEEKEAVNGDNRVSVESETEQVISEEKPVNEVVAAATEVGEEKICGVETSVEVASVTAAVATAGGETFQSEDNSVFSTFTHNKPYTEVFTSAQGSFNFLQESQIDPDSPHMDPAVVAAHPMVPPASVRTNFAGVGGQPAGELLSQQFPNQVNEVVLNSNSSANIPQSHYIQPVPAITATHLQDFSQIPTQTYTNQHYVAVPTFAAPIYSTQAVAPPPNLAATTAANKLSAFESISYKGGVTGGVGAAVEESSGEVNTPPDSANNEVNEDRHKFSSNDNFQSANQGNYQARNGGYNYRGGPRGTGSGGRGLRGMNNGYSGRGGGGRGGNFNNNGRGGGGGGGSNNYQGNFRDNNYNNYQRENFNNGYNGTNNGGGGGSRRGAGGASNINRGSRGGGGGNVSRGGNSSRGGGGGNFTKAAA